MAISGGDGSIILTTKVDQTGLKKGLGSIGKTAKSFGAGVAKSFAVIGAAAATATVAITKMATDAYADYEQLVGGVETLFKGSAQKVIDYANDAFYTAGKSANEFLDLTITFANSLIQGLGGDTERAADLANMAIIDMSDNVNRLGSDVQMVEYAYRGLARQEFRMLDNLKLGYQGTAAEMARLINDSKVMGEGFVATAENVRSISFDKYIEAIHEIQVQLGIAGTTSYEATETIVGSAKMMKAAWQNALSAIAGGGDIDRAVNNLVYSVRKYFDNLLPVVKRSLVGIGQLIEEVAPSLVQNVASALIQAIPSLLMAIVKMIIGLAKGIYEGIKALFTGSGDVVKAELTTKVDNVANSFGDAAENANAFGSAVEDAGKKAKKSLATFDTIQTLASPSSSGDVVDTEMPSISAGGVTEFTVPEVELNTKNIEEAPSKVSKVVKKMQTAAVEYAGLFEPSYTAWEEQSDKVEPVIKKSGKKIISTLAELGKNTLLPLATDVATEFIPNVTNAFNENVAPMAGDIAAAGAEQIAKDVEWGATQVTKVTNDVIKPALETTEKITTDSLNIVGEQWKENGKEIVEQTTLAADKTKGVWDSFYDSTLAPMFKTVADGLDALWDEHLKDLWDNIVFFFSSLWENVMTIWNTVLGPFVQWLIEIVGPSVSGVFQDTWNVLSDIFGVISDVVGGVLEALGGLLNFITGVFTGDWNKAWSGIKDFFVGIWDIIWGVVKGVINLIIGALNTVWSAIYYVVKGIVDILSTVASVIGSIFGQDWSFSLPDEPPRIPLLAQGAVLPPNKPFLALVGDQKNGTNIEAPLQTIVDAFNIALNNRGTSDTVKEEHYYLDETELMSVVYRLAKGGERLNGNSLIKGGI